MRSESTIKMAAKIYDARDTARRLFGREFQTKCDEVKVIIQGVAKKESLDTIPAMIRCMERVSGHTMATMWLLAAACEIIEPSY